jgi:cytochrome bd ubiquinol oxidase subunit II
MTTLQIIWFLLVGVLLAGYAILDGFDLGVGVLHLFVAKDDRERRITINSIGPVWDGNEVWLLTGGGAIFAAFPKVYATVFSGFYLALMLLLVALILRAVALEFRGKLEGAGWRKVWDGAFALGSLLPALLFGVAIGNILRGVPLTQDGEFAGTFLGLLNPFAVIVGLLSTAMFTMQGASWLILKTEGAVQQRARNAGLGAWISFVVLWIAATLYAAVEAPHLSRNFHSPLAWLVPIVFITCTAAWPFALRKSGGRAFTVSSLAIAGLLGIVGLSLFPYLVPGRPALGESLTIANASSSPLTLTVMLTIALIGMPIVVAYTAFIYHKFLAPVVLDEHSY